MAESTQHRAEWTEVDVHYRHHSHLERLSVVHHRSSTGRRRQRQSEDPEPAPLRQRRRRSLSSPSGRRTRRRREHTGHDSSSGVGLSTRVMSSSGESRTSRSSSRPADTCIDLTEDTLSTTPAVVDLTVTPTQPRPRNERVRKDSSDVEITGETDLKTQSASRFVTCPVCLEMGAEFQQTGRAVVSTKCGHVFCDLCLKQAIQENKKCPTCRHPLKMKDFHELYL